jgi:phage terminase large subunit-like protein
MSSAEQYAHWVLSPTNSPRTGRLIKLAAQRFLNDLKRDDIYFDEEEAGTCINFGERYCNQWEGDWEGQPFSFEPWQKFILQQVYGWIKKKDGKRRFNEVYVQVAKKNGKSSMCAVISLFHLLADLKVNTPKVFTAANNEDQAKICVNMAGQVVKKSPELNERYEEGVMKLSTYGINITEVIDLERNGFIKALSKETGDKTSKTYGGKHGINASLGVVDEFGMADSYGNAKNIKTSMVSRSERLMFYITTAGYNMDGPAYRDLRAVGIKVLEGALVMDNYLPMLYELDEGDDWMDEKNWQKPNPNLGVSVNVESLRDMVADAVAYGGTTEVEVKTLNFDMWVDSPDTFIPSEVWNENTHGLSEDDLLGQVCYGGIELVGGKYLNAFCLLFPDINGLTVLKPLFWMPEKNKDSKETDQYKNWDGFIKTFLGDVPDNDAVFNFLESEINKYQMHSFSYKSNLETNDIIQGLIKNGYQGNPISHGYQGISTPTKAYEDLLTSRQVEHFKNPVLTWMNSNCTAVRKDNDVRLEKSGSKVVGIYAAINALAQAKTIEAEGTGEIGILYL